MSAARTSGERVLLLHGIWTGGVMMSRLAAHLAAAGYQPEGFDYASISAGADVAAEQLRDRLAEYREPVHLIGHSLGGLVALLATRDSTLPGRTLCLASPLCGSSAADRLARFAPWMMGRSSPRLRSGLDPWRGPREVGVIAGRIPFGVGRWFGGFDDENDGTVAVAETRLPGIHAHCVVAATHTGIVFSNDVARLAAGFLKNGELPVAA